MPLNPRRLIQLLAALSLLSVAPAAAQVDISDDLIQAIVSEYERHGVTPLLQQRFAGVTSQAEIQSQTTRLAARGIARLSDDDVLDRARSLYRLDGLAPEELCAARFMGTMDPTKLPVFLRPLRDEEITQYAGWVARAVRAELDATIPPKQPPPEQAQETLQTIMASMGAKDRERFTAVMGATATASTTDLCWASQLFTRTILELEPAARTRALRLMVLTEAGYR